MTSQNSSPLFFHDNLSVNGKADQFMIVTVKSDAVIKSWKESLFSFEWLRPDGSLRPYQELGESQKEKIDQVREQINKGDELERPVLGIGLFDQIEIASRKDVFLTLYQMGHKTIEVHILKSDINDFEDFIDIKK